jgi:hypothetical protein
MLVGCGQILGGMKWNEKKTLPEAETLLTHS